MSQTRRDKIKELQSIREPQVYSTPHTKQIQVDNAHELGLLH
jgi:hypothetical protein